jgi:outer membrane protein assembly factor BamB
MNAGTGPGNLPHRAAGPPRRLLAGLGVVLGLTAAGADWPNFRGPGGLGVGEGRGLPVRWAATENVLWKRRLPGPGASSPITWGGRVFVTCYTGYGVAKGGGDQGKLRRHLLCIDAKSGDVLWQREVAARLPETRYGGFIAEHGYASSTPATDGERVYVFFGRSGVLAFDLEGRPLWQTRVGDALNGWGSAASPVLYKGLVLVNATVESGALVALDRRSGKEVWRARGLLDTWSTPVLAAAGGGHEVVLNAPGALLGFDPETGRKLWECTTAEGSAATSTPVTRDGIVYAMGGGVEGPTAVAVRAGGRGEVTETHTLWRQKAGGGVCSPVLYGDYLYWVSGRAWCLRADTGRVAFRERLYNARQEYASAVAADGKLFAFTRRNGAYVLAATGKFEQRAHNDLGDDSDFNASPAVSDGRILVRSNEYLYSVGIAR